MWCVIPAAGRGDRLASLTGGGPKPLLEVNGTSLIEGVLSRVATAVDQVCIVTPEGDRRIADALAARSTGPALRFVSQPEPSGVGHAVLQAADLVRGSFLVVMADAFYSGDLEPFVAAWRASGDDGAVLVEAPTGVASAVMGRVRVSGGRVVEMAKAKAHERWDLRIAGAFLLPEAAFDALARSEPAWTGEIELETAVTALLARGLTFAAVPYAGWRTNVNRPEDVRSILDRLAVEVPDGSE